MRSEERSGIVFAIMLILWGTLLTEPLRIFADYSVHVFNKVLSLIGIGTDNVVNSVVVIVLMTALAVALLLLSSTAAVRYIPIGITALTVVAFLRDCLKDNSVDSKRAAAILIMCFLIGVMHLLKSDTALIWTADFYIASIPTYLLVSLVIVPIVQNGGLISKILYISRYAKGNLSLPFSGIFTLPAIVWGIFFYILSFIFILYFSFSRKNG